MKQTKKQFNEAAIKSGRVCLKKWLGNAEKCGVIYYRVEHVARSGMSRRIILSTIVNGRVKRLWPICSGELACGTNDYADALDVVAKDWGFSFTHGSFVVAGCGMDMVFALIDDLAAKSGMKNPIKWPHGFANHIEKESL